MGKKILILIILIASNILVFNSIQIYAVSNYSDYELTYYEVELALSNSNTEEEFLDLIDQYSNFADAHEAYDYGVPSYTINIPNSGGQDL